MKKTLFNVSNHLGHILSTFNWSDALNEAKFYSSIQGKAEIKVFDQIEPGQYSTIQFENGKKIQTQ